MGVELRPLGDRVLVRRVEGAEKIGSIIVPDSAKEKPTEGVVEGVGDGRIGKKGNRLPMHLSKGDRVLFGRYAGTDVKLEGEPYTVLRETEVFAIL